MTNTLTCAALLAACLLVACGDDEEQKGGCGDLTPATCYNGQLDPNEECDSLPDGSNGVFNNDCNSVMTGVQGAQVQQWGGQLQCQCCMIKTDLCFQQQQQPQFQTNGGAGG